MQPAPSSELDEPIGAFSRCHAGFTALLRELRQLPALLLQAELARDIAQRSLAGFAEGMRRHHQDEEAELFPAVLRHAVAGAEAEQVAGMIERLTREHRAAEKVWRRLERHVRDAARGKAARVDTATIEELVTACLLHANFEEQYFLPLAERILGRDSANKAALGMALHLRHVPVPAIGYL
ncbi:MAG TPA: hemerythrin domain-containing protein [Ramlibacter sp.]|uniref:hemerythrin domain-containing protein n=1 Tax=Ramlibacter sp. TaxID=1917967 RepID=UPI002C754B00|nr:hemerythrin domain-containing protein [Ramlibacter sp.]HVZ43131.1 hemerythrin domain-containing protein [Ramlibacter sp.]